MVIGCMQRTVLPLINVMITTGTITMTAVVIIVVRVLQL